MNNVLKYSISNLLSRKGRSFLTILSILIGIAAIVALSSFGLGIKYYMEDIARTMGADKIMIMPKDYATALGESNVEFTERDLDFLKRIKGVDEATGMIVSVGKVKFKDYKEVYPYVTGISTNSKERRLAEEMFVGYGIIEGRTLKKGDVLKATLGYNYLIPNNLFKKPVSLGDKIKINDIEVEVVGFYEEIGNPQDDSNVYLSLEGAKKILGKENYFFILLRAAPDQNVAELGNRIKEKFRKYRDQKEGEEDFFVQTYEEIIETYGSVINIFIGVLVLIALISVFVAAVNIANTMYSSILERTQEIGIMKAIGAKNRFIALMFMFEAGILGLVGGGIGILLGYGIAKVGGIMAASAGLSMLKPAFPLWLITGCLVFAFLVGSFSGLFPAIQASKLKPVDTLRYE